MFYKIVIFFFTGQLIAKNTVISPDFLVLKFWTGFYMVTASVMKELIVLLLSYSLYQLHFLELCSWLDAEWKNILITLIKLYLNLLKYEFSLACISPYIDRIISVFSRISYIHMYHMYLYIVFIYDSYVFIYRRCPYTGKSRSYEWNFIVIEQIE